MPATPTTPASAAKKRGHVDRSIDQKVKVLEMLKKGSRVAEVARELGIPKNTIYQWKKDETRYQQRQESGKSTTVKRARTSAHPNIDEATVTWLRQATERKDRPPITGEMIRSVAEDFAVRFGLPNWRASNGWFQRFKEANKVLYRVVCGASLDAPNTDEYVEEFLIPTLSEYAPEDVYNADEAMLFYKMLPNRSYCLSGKSKLSKYSYFYVIAL